MIQLLAAFIPAVFVLGAISYVVQRVFPNGSAVEPYPPGFQFEFSFMMDRPRTYRSFGAGGDGGGDGGGFGGGDGGGCGSGDGGGGCGGH